MPLRRDLVSMNTEEIRGFLHNQLFAVVATQWSPTLIHQTTLVCIHDEQLVIESDTFAKSQKVLNVTRRPHASMLVEATSESRADEPSYDAIKGALISGRAEIDDDIRAVRRVWDGKYEKINRLGFGHPDNDFDKYGSKRVVLRIFPDRVASWDHMKLHGRY